MRRNRVCLCAVSCLALAPALHAPAEPPARTDLYGDPLPAGALARFGTIYLKADFNKLAFREDGREFYSWKGSGLLRVHDAATGKVLRAFLLPAAGHSGFHFSARGRFLTAGVDRGVADPAAKALTVWETTTGKLRRRIEAPAGDAFDAWGAPLHDGRTLVTCELRSGAVRLWDIESGTNRLVRKASEAVYGIALSPDGKRLFVRTQDTFQCWATADGQELWQTPTAGGGYLVVAPDGRALLTREMVVGATLVRFLDPATGKPHPKLRHPPKALGWPQWGADSGTLLIPQWNAKVVQVWDLEAGKERSRLPWAYGAIAMSPTGDSLLGEGPGLQRWDLRTGKPLYPSTADRGNVTAVEDLVWSPDGKHLISVGRDGSIYFWDVETSRPIHVLRDADGARLAFTPDGNRLIVGTNDGTLLVCDPTSGKVLNRQKLENMPDLFWGLHGMKLCDRGRLLLNGGHKGLSVRAWSLGPGGVTGAWDTATGKRLWLRTAEGVEGLIGLSPDGRLGVDWNLSLREVQSGRFVGALGETDGRSKATNHKTEFSQDGGLIATHTSRLANAKDSDSWEDAGIEVWERATRRLVRVIPLKGWMLPFAPDGRRLATLGQGEVWVRDVARGRELLHLRAPGDVSYWHGTRLAFAPNGQTLALATEDGSILLWNVPARAPAALPVLGADEVRQAWKNLGDADPAKAFAAVADLADRPGQAVALLKERIHPVAPTPTEEVRRLVAALDDEDFQAREAADRKLAVLGPVARPVLREALGKRPSEEVRKRLERLLDEQRPPSEDVLRGQRAVRVLAWAGTTEARDFLGVLGSGDPAAPLTQEAAAALRQLGPRPSGGDPRRR